MKERGIGTAVVVLIAVVVVAIAIIASYFIIANRALVRSVTISISPTSQSGAIGATLTYTVNVTNTGSVSDNYSLTVSDTVAWSVSVSRTSLELAAGSSGTSTLTVTLPSLIVTGPSSELGTIDNITVTADGTGVSISAGCTAQVLIPRNENTVNIQNFAFDPQSITVNVGTTIIWKNLDSVDHTVTTIALDPIGQGSFDSGNISPGGTFQFKFENVGVYNYECTIHGFTGTVVVQ